MHGPGTGPRGRINVLPHRNEAEREGLSDHPGLMGRYRHDAIDHDVLETSAKQAGADRGYRNALQPLAV
jgi:hypothetical protein